MPKTCGTCEHATHYCHPCHAYCWAPLPMWADDGDRPLVNEHSDATHCAAYRERQKEAANG